MLINGKKICPTKFEIRIIAARYVKDTQTKKLKQVSDLFIYKELKTYNGVVNWLTKKLEEIKKDPTVDLDNIEIHIE